MKNKLMLCLKLTVLPALMVAVLLLASLFLGGVVFADLSMASFLFYGTLAAYIISLLPADFCRLRAAGVGV